MGACMTCMRVSMGRGQGGEQLFAAHARGDLPVTCRCAVLFYPNMFVWWRAQFPSLSLFHTLVLLSHTPSPLPLLSVGRSVGLSVCPSVFPSLLPSHLPSHQPCTCLLSPVCSFAAPLGPIRVMQRDMDTTDTSPPFWTPLQDSPSEDLISALVSLLPTTKLTERAEEETHDFLTKALQHVLQHPAIHWWCNPQLRPISMEMLTLFGFEENESLKGYKGALENVLGGCLDCTEAYQQDRRIFISRYEIVCNHIGAYLWNLQR